MRQLFWSAVAVAVLGACGPDSAAVLDEDGDSEGLELAVSELNVSLILPFLNGPDATLEVLDGDVGLDGRAARNIVTRVRGADLVLGTPDDRPIVSLADLDAIAYVGEAAIAAIDRFVTARGGSSGTPVVVEGVSFSGAQAAMAVAVTNDARLFQVSMSEYQRANLMHGRPHANVASIAATAGIGPVALQKLKTFTASQLPPTPAPTPTPGVCSEVEGKRDGVLFTAAEACKAVEFLNRARTSEMYNLSKAAIDFAWSGGPYRPNGATGRSEWARLNEFTDAAGIGATTVANLRDRIVHGWQPNGLTSDTVATTWSNRQALKDKPVRFERVYVKRVLPMEQDPNRSWVGFICAELRDTPTASNFVFACQTLVGADSASGCSARDCITNKAGTYVNLRGELNATGMPGSGGFRVNFSTEPLAPSPAVP